MSDDRFPLLRSLGVDGYLVTFDAELSEPANRAALALRSAIERAGWDGVEESTTSLISTYLRFDALSVDHAMIRGQLQALLESQDWFAADLPEGRRLWRIPTVFGGDRCPQLDAAAELAGLSPEAAIAQIAATKVRVQTIGFAPGMPYLGELPAAWNIPRQTELTKSVPVGALAVAIRQLVLFPVTSTTGWRHIGQTAFRPFQPEAERPFVLNPGDEVLFEPVDRATFEAMRTSAPNGGATFEVLP